MLFRTALFCMSAVAVSGCVQRPASLSRPGPHPTRSSTRREDPRGLRTRRVVACVLDVSRIVKGAGEFAVTKPEARGRHGKSSLETTSQLPLCRRALDGDCVWFASARDANASGGSCDRADRAYPRPQSPTLVRPPVRRKSAARRAGKVSRQRHPAVLLMPLRTRLDSTRCASCRRQRGRGHGLEGRWQDASRCAEPDTRP